MGSSNLKNFRYLNQGHVVMPGVPLLPLMVTCSVSGLAATEFD
jgi:hypothetical protein